MDTDEFWPPPPAPDFWTQELRAPTDVADPHFVQLPYKSDHFNEPIMLVPRQSLAVPVVVPAPIDLVGTRRRKRMRRWLYLCRRLLMGLVWS